MRWTTTFPSPACLVQFSCGPKTFLSVHLDGHRAPGYICTSVRSVNHSVAVQWSKALDLSACHPRLGPVVAPGNLSCRQCHAVCPRRVQHLIWTNEVSIKTPGPSERGKERSENDWNSIFATKTAKVPRQADSQKWDQAKVEVEVVVAVAVKTSQVFLLTFKWRANYPRKRKTTERNVDEDAARIGWNNSPIPLHPHPHPHPHPIPFHPTCHLPPNCFSCCSMNMLNCLLHSFALAHYPAHPYPWPSLSKCL